MIRKQDQTRLPKSLVGQIRSRKNCKLTPKKTKCNKQTDRPTKSPTCMATENDCATLSDETRRRQPGNTDTLTDCCHLFPELQRRFLDRFCRGLGGRGGEGIDYDILSPSTIESIASLLGAKVLCYRGISNRFFNLRRFLHFKDSKYSGTVSLIIRLLPSSSLSQLR